MRKIVLSLLIFTIHLNAIGQNYKEKINKYLSGRRKASLKPCMSAVLTGTLAGGLTGLIG